MFRSTPDDDDVLNAFAHEINSNFADASLEFTNVRVTRKLGLEVLVPDKRLLKEVKQYCKWLEKNHPLKIESRVPVKLIVKAA